MVIAFVIWEWKGATFPMVPRELFAGQRMVAMSYLVAFVSGMYFYAILNFIPVMYLDIYNPNPVQAGLKGVIIALGVTAGAVLPNMMLSVWKSHNREILLALAILTTAFGTALVTCTPENPVRTIAIGTVAGFGIGGVVACAVTTAVIASPDDLIATCVALSLSIRTVGGSVGTAIYSNILKTKLVRNLPKYVASYAIAAGLPPSSARPFVELFLTAPQNLTTPAGAAEVPGLTAAVLQGATIGSRWAYAESLKYVWYTSLPFGILACITCLLLGKSTRFMTNRIAADIGRERN
jgi:Fungal trichothecene efflux pump (TRI12)